MRVKTQLNIFTVTNEKCLEIIFRKAVCKITQFVLKPKSKVFKNELFSAIFLYKKEQKNCDIKSFNMNKPKYSRE